MKVQYASDLHLEMSKMPHFEVLPEADLLVFAGDIHSKPLSLQKFLLKIRRQHEKLPIVVVPGNHEYYGQVFQKVQLEYAAVCEEIGGVHYLDNGYLEMGHYRIIGSTLYSDLAHPLDAIAAKQGITDFRVVKIEDDGGVHPLSTSFWTAQHLRAREFIGEALSTQPVATTIVVTHFVPSRSLVLEQFRGDRTNAAFLTDMDVAMEKYKPALWIYGHDHRAFIDTTIHQTRIVCNQRGYYFEKNGYQPRFVEVP